MISAAVSFHVRPDEAHAYFEVQQDVATAAMKENSARPAFYERLGGMATALVDLYSWSINPLDLALNRV